jgi:FAD:protein FMN transferase
MLAMKLDSQPILYEIWNRMSIKKALFILLFLLYMNTLQAGAQQEAVKSQVEPQRSSELMLGTVCTLTIYDNPHEAAFEKAFNRIEAIENQMSITRESSIVSQINREAGQNPVVVPPETFTVIEEALYIASLSQGAFDPTVGPLTAAWAIGTDSPRVPSNEEIARLIPLVAWETVETDPQASTVFLPEPGMRLDLGGIAKGFAADEVRTILQDSGVNSAIVNLGGNVLTIGTKPDGSLFNIGIQNPAEDRGTYIMIVSISDTTIVSSGPYERYFSVGETLYHHILDPDSGYPVHSEVGGVSIFSESSFIADALSTAFFVMGIERGMALVESLAGIDAAAVTWDNQIIVSSGFTDGSISYRITDDSFRAVPAAEYLQTR